MLNSELNIQRTRSTHSGIRRQKAKGKNSKYKGLEQVIELTHTGIGTMEPGTKNKEQRTKNMEHRTPLTPNQR